MHIDRPTKKFILILLLFCYSAITMSTLIFSYGSNSLAQLRGRVLNNDLIGRPAIAVDWTRIFCLTTQHWGGSDSCSAVASLAHSNSARTLGSVVELSDVEIERLNHYERLYTLTEINIQIGQSTVTEKAFAYLADDSTYLTSPSEFYLTAIHCMLRENFPDGGAIAINRVRKLNSNIDTNSKNNTDDNNINSNNDNYTDNIEHIYDYIHPKIRDLAIASLCVEVNILKKNPWIMPIDGNRIKSELQSVGIENTIDLIEHLSSSLKTKNIEDIFVNAGISKRDDDTIPLFKSLLGI